MSDRADQVEVQTGTRYRVDADGDGTVRVQFEAVLETVGFDPNGNYSGMRFDNGVHLYVWSAEAGFTMEAAALNEGNEREPGPMTDQESSDGIYQHPLFIEVRNRASDLEAAHEVAMAGLRTVWEVTHDPATRKLAIRLYNSIRDHSEGRHD